MRLSQARLCGGADSIQIVAIRLEASHMTAGFDGAVAVMAMVLASVLMTAVSLWIGGRMAPWFLKERVDPPTVRSYFFHPGTEMNLTRERMVAALAALAVLLAMLLALAAAARFGGLAATP